MLEMQRQSQPNWQSRVSRPRQSLSTYGSHRLGVRFDSVLKHPFDFRFNLKFSMAQGRDLRLPRQFSGLTGRVPGPTPAAEDYESLVQHQRIWRDVLHEGSLSLTLHELFHFGLFTKHINTCRTFMEADPHHIFGNPYTAEVFNECKRCNINVDSTSGSGAGAECEAMCFARCVKRLGP